MGQLEDEVLRLKGEDYNEGYKAGARDTQRDAVKATGMIVLSAGGEVRVPYSMALDDVDFTVAYNDFTNEVIYKAQRR